MINQLKTGVVLSYLNIVLGNVISVLYTPIMLRLLGQAEYGLYSLASSVVGYFSIMSFGLGSVIVRYAVQYKTKGAREAEYRLYGMFLAIYTFIACLVCLVSLVLLTHVGDLFSNKLSLPQMHKIKLLMMIMIANFAVSLPLSVFSSIVTAYEKYVFPKIVTVFTLVVNPIIMLPLLLHGYKSIAMTMVVSILLLAGSLLNVYYCIFILHVKIRFKSWDIKVLKEMGGYSFFVLLSLIVDRVFWSTDQVIVGMVSGAVAVAVYSIGSQFSAYYMSFSTAISGVFFPRVTAMVVRGASNSEISSLFIKAGRVQYIMMAYILVGFIVFGKDFIYLWAGGNYDRSYYIALVVMIPLTIPLIQGLGLPLLQARNQQAFRSNIYLAIAILNVVGSIYLAKIWGGVGCALASGIAFFIGHGITMNAYYYKKHKIDIPLFWREISLLTIPVILSFIVGASLSIFAPVNSVFFLMVKVAFYTICYIVFMWSFGMNKYERGLFGGVVARGFGKIRALV